MSDVWGENLPILYGRSVATGELVHVDDAPNGKACGCVCPDPGCGQPLIARNNGKKKIHHFAHIGGTCAWSAEYLLAELALEVIRERGCVWFPELSYEVPETHLPERISKGMELPVDCAEKIEVEGRKAPAIGLDVRTSRGCARYVFVPELAHVLGGEQIASLRKECRGIVKIGFRGLMRSMKTLEHYDREELAVRIQSKAVMEELLSGGAPAASELGVERQGERTQRPGVETLCAAQGRRKTKSGRREGAKSRHRSGEAREDAPGGRQEGRKRTGAAGSGDKGSSREGGSARGLGGGASRAGEGDTR